MATLTAPHRIEKPVSVVEEAGVITSLHSSILVTAITGSTVSARLVDVYNALDSGGYAAFSSVSSYPHLVLVKRDVEFYKNDTNKAIATLEYGLRGHNYSEIGTFTAKMASSLQQIKTDFDIFGHQIVVGHQYTGDPNFGSQFKEVSANVQQLMPQSEITYNGLFLLADPIAFRNAFLGHINSFYWNGGEPTTWLCTECNIEPYAYNLTATLWAITISFQYDPTGWNQLAVFLDPSTNKPPLNLEPGVGIVPVQTQPFADFWEIIPG